METSTLKQLHLSADNDAWTAIHSQWNFLKWTFACGSHAHDASYIYCYRVELRTSLQRPIAVQHKFQVMNETIGLLYTAKQHILREKSLIQMLAAYLKIYASHIDPKSMF